MASLYLIQSAFNSQSLSEQLELVSAGDTVVLIENGVRLAQTSSATNDVLNKLEVTLFGLKSDCEAHGVATEAAQISYDELVTLMTSHHPIVTL